VRSEVRAVLPHTTRSFLRAVLSPARAQNNQHTPAPLTPICPPCAPRGLRPAARRTMRPGESRRGRERHRRRARARISFSHALSPPPPLPQPRQSRRPGVRAGRPLRLGHRDGRAGADRAAGCRAGAGQAGAGGKREERESARRRAPAPLECLRAGGALSLSRALPLTHSPSSPHTRKTQPQPPQPVLHGQRGLPAGGATSLMGEFLGRARVSVERAASARGCGAFARLEPPSARPVREMDVRPPYWACARIGRGAQAQLRRGRVT